MRPLGSPRTVDTVLRAVPGCAQALKLEERIRQLESDREESAAATTDASRPLLKQVRIAQSEICSTKYNLSCRA